MNCFHINVLLKLRFSFSENYVFLNSNYFLLTDKEINVTHHSGRSLTSSSKKQRKARTAFSDHQLHSLEKSFTRQKYLSVQDRMELANKLGISDTQVKTWFQNRR